MAHAARRRMRSRSIPTIPAPMSSLPAVKFSQGDANGALKTLAPIPKDRTRRPRRDACSKINIFNQKGDRQQVEALLRKLIELYPTVPSFRTQLVQFYLQNKRPGRCGE